MLTRLRTTGLAWAGTLIIVLAMSGVALGSVVLTADQAPVDESATVDTTATFEDLDGNGVDDDCQTDVVPDEEQAAAAEAAVDLDGDGTISVSEAARSDRTGGKNCNHGGYVSQVARGQCDDGTTEDADEATDDDQGQDGDEATEAEEAEEADEADEAEAAEPCEPAEETTDESTEEAAEETTCEEVAAPVYDPAKYSGPGGFGRYVSEVAQSDAIGGKNCNHGGAVSEAVRAAKEQIKAERDAAKAERKAERDAKKAERDAAKAERKAGKQHGN